MLPVLLLLPGLFSELMAEPAAVVEIHGLIGSDVDADEIVATLEGLEGYSALILDIDSPGGSAVDSHKIVKAVRELGIPKVALIGNSATSGAYWIAAACDQIVADELSFVGSIGATTRFINIEGLAEKLGASVDLISYPENKSFGNPFRDMTPEEAAYAERMVEAAGSYFQESIVELRPESVGYVDGLPYIAYDAPQLVDGFGGFSEALAAAEEMAGTKLEPEYFLPDTGLMDFLKNFMGLRAESPLDFFELVFKIPYYL